MKTIELSQNEINKYNRPLNEFVKPCELKNKCLKLVKIGVQAWCIDKNKNLVPVKKNSKTAFVMRFEDVK